MIIYLQMIESDEDKSKFEQLYIMYKGLMFHVAMKTVSYTHLTLPTSDLV